jgi:hypothetical protein
MTGFLSFSRPGVSGSSAIGRIVMRGSTRNTPASSIAAA